MEPSDLMYIIGVMKAVLATGRSEGIIGVRKRNTNITIPSFLNK